jgi:hypothetical protein
MKKTLLTTTALLISLPMTASYAVDAHQPDQQGQGQSMSGQQGSGMMMENMQANMKTMMQQMDEIRNTEDPDKRDKLIEEHMKSMQGNMEMMRGMGGGMMMGMMGGKQQGGQMGGDMTMRMDRMEQRMDMMQMMMDQMVQSQDAVEKTRKRITSRKGGPR